MRSHGISYNIWNPEASGSCGSKKISILYLKYVQKIDISSHLMKKNLEFVLKGIVTSFRSEFLGDSNT